MILAIAVSIYFVTRDNGSKEEPVTPEDPEPVVENTSFSLIAFGDALIHNGVYT